MGEGTRVAAVVLGGGRSRRLGTDKLALEVGGSPLLRHSVDAAAAVGARVVVVGPDPGTLPPDVTVVREDPPYSGPYAGVVAGLAAVDPSVDVVLVLAGDLVDPGSLLPRLLDALAGGADTAVAVDAAGHRQPLLAAYRTSSLLRVVAGVDPRDRPARALLDGLRVVEVDDHGTHTRDVDTADDLARETPRHGDSSTPRTPSDRE